MTTINEAKAAEMARVRELLGDVDDAPFHKQPRSVEIWQANMAGVLHTNVKIHRHPQGSPSELDLVSDVVKFRSDMTEGRRKVAESEIRRLMARRSLLERRRIALDFEAIGADYDPDSDTMVDRDTTPLWAIHAPLVLESFLARVGYDVTKIWGLTSYSGYAEDSAATRKAATRGHFVLRIENDETTEVRLKLSDDVLFRFLVESDTSPNDGSTRSWHTATIEIPDLTIPETMISALIGEHIGKLVEHPDLSDPALVIHSVRNVTRIASGRSGHLRDVPGAIIAIAPVMTTLTAIPDIRPRKSRKGKR